MFKTKNRRETEILQEAGVPFVSIENKGANYGGKAGESLIKEVTFNVDEDKAVEIISVRKEKDIKEKIELDGEADKLSLLMKKIEDLEKQVKDKKPQIKGNK